jgi:hypothetical protein
VLTPLATKESWIRVSGVDFGNGAQNLRIKAANVGDGNKVEIHKGSVSGTLAGTCELAKTGNWNSYVDNDCEMSGLSGVVDELFFVFKGSKDSTMGLLEWEFQGTKREPEPQTPFGGKVWNIPGKIEAENFDEPGYGAGNDSYAENDSDNHGDSELRKGTGVDLYEKETGVVVGYNQAGEWLEYTVNVKEAGDYTMYASVATDNSTAGFKLSIDGDAVAEVPVSGSSWDEFTKVKANLTLPAGEHILRFEVTGDWFDIDYFNFVAGKDAPESTTAITAVKLQNKIEKSYNVFSLTGKKLGTVDLSRMDAPKALNAAGFAKGVYMLKQVQGSKTFMVNTNK